MKHLGAFLLISLTAQLVVAQNPVGVSLVPWAENVGSVTDIAVNGDGRFYVASQNGIVRIVADSMQVLPTPFLDISSITLNNSEQGLLGLAFDPAYAENGRFYAFYVHNGSGSQGRISRFQVSADPDIALAASETILYTVPWGSGPFHKGGDLEFGPDGMLYISTGDGFLASNAQNLGNKHGKILRIDVSGATFAIPPDNPFVNAGPDTLPEIFATGLRNPFRIGFDSGNGDLWIGDVGQANWEELDRIAAGDNSGPNFGWPCYEGSSAYDLTGCAAPNAYTAPVIALSHASSGGNFCSVMTGRVYHGAQWPHFADRFFYTDYCNADIYNLRSDGLGGYINELSLDTLMSGNTCIVEDDAGELFLGNRSQGKIFRIIDRCPMDAPVIEQDGNLLFTTSTGSLQWYFNGSVSPGETGPEYEPIGAGMVHLTADHGNGCLLTSEAFQFIPTIVSATGNDMGLEVKPNPASENLTISLSRQCLGCSVQVIGPLGQLIAEVRMSGTPIAVLDISAWADGLYAIRLFQNGGSGEERIAIRQVAVIR